MYGFWSVLLVFGVILVDLVGDGCISWGQVFSWLFNVVYKNKEVKWLNSLVMKGGYSQILETFSNIMNFFSNFC